MTWVLIDVSFLAYRALRSVGYLEHEDAPTGVMFGFWNQFRAICDDPKIRSTKAALFFDSRRSFRSKAFPPYKRSRRKDRDPAEVEQIHMMWDQVKVLRRDVLPAVGLPCYRQTGVESDDLMAFAAADLAKTHVNQGFGPRRGVIVTADQDLFQCINDHVSWYDPMRGIYWTPETFQEAKGIHPSRWGEVKSIAGDTGDGVPGVQGVGEVTAVRYLTGSLPPRYKAHDKIISKEGREIRERNKGLVCLPHERTKPFDLVEPEYNVEAFFHYAKRYGLMTFLNPDSKRGWERFFTRKRPRLRRPGEGRRRED